MFAPSNNGVDLCKVNLEKILEAILGENSKQIIGFFVNYQL